jgi:DNA-binding transcriptional LysR family regulator
MHFMHISAVDLNLVVVLRALLDERSVSRAARRLGLSQSATSHALGRLRALVKDPLFVRTRAGLVPTARGEAMADTVRSSVAALETTLLAPPSFDPRSRSAQR